MTAKVFGMLILTFGVFVIVYTVTHPEISPLIATINFGIGILDILLGVLIVLTAKYKV